jgi:hypothetical protein
MTVLLDIPFCSYYGRRMNLRYLPAAARYMTQSFTEAIQAVYPHARFQADHFHTVKNIWGHLKKALLSYRRQVKVSGEANNDAHLMAVAKQVWKLRWVLLKKPANS